MSISKIKTSANWCSKVDSPTYKLTWYIVNNEIFNDPQKLNNMPDKYNSTNNEAVSNSKAVVIASSGETSEYSIENLVIQTRMVPGASTGNTTTGTFQFDIYEPGGFLLVNRILQLSKIFDFTNIQQAKYVLKVEFIGRKITDSSTVRFDGAFYYPMLISSLRATAGPEGSQYNFVASNQHKIAIASSKNITDIKLSGITDVESLIKQLGIELNKQEESIRKTKETDEVHNPKKWIIQVDKSFEKYLKSVLKEASTDIGGTGQKADITDSAAAQYAIRPGKNIVTYLIDTLTEQVPDYYNTFNNRKDENKTRKEKTSSALSGEGNRAKAFDATYENEFITVTPEIKMTDKKDLYTNAAQEIVTLTIKLKTSLTVPQVSGETQAWATSNASYQNRRLEMLPIYKSYSYLFTGTNTEVLDFDLNYDSMFIQTIDPSNALSYAKITGDMGTGEATNITKAPPQTLSNLSVNNTSFNTQIENSTYTISTLYSHQQRNSSESNSIIAKDQREIYAASNDFMSLNIGIKGDPYWLGTPGSHVNTREPTLIDNLDEDSLLAFVNYLPAMSAGVRKLDIASSGVYKVTDVESKFQLGKFTQQIQATRDTNSSTDLIQKRLIEIGSLHGN
jgi:hypothetical protein|tara:strand:+ start:854 stop:2716 length:1863 start_codon:yes stop_codon:yes gene_type:complete